MGGKAEQVLWNYRHNLKRVEEWRYVVGQLQSVQGQSYGACVMNGVSYPVFEVVRKKLALEKKIVRAEKEIHAVEDLRERLTLNIDELDIWQMLGILDWRYINHIKQDKVIRELGITKATYYRRRNELVKCAEEYLA